MSKQWERFASKIKINNSCWEWLGRLDRDGYGQFDTGGKPVKAHRWIYEFYYGSIDKRTIDHLCRNRKCVNPFHLELVELKINLLRGNGPTAINARKTHCKRGHEFTTQNTYIDKKHGRSCRICLRLKDSKRIKVYNR